MYTVNCKYFNDLTESSSYTLGLWWADGCIYIKRDKYKFIFDLAQHVKDKYILEKIRTEMGSNHPFIEQNNLVRLQICSRPLVESVMSYGGIERKSKTIGLPQKLNRNQMVCFLRGYFDGDGSIFLDKQSQKYRSSFSSGSEVFINSLMEYLRKKVHGFRGYIRHRKNDSGEWHELSMGVNDTIRLGGYLYQDDPKFFLERKRNIFNLAGEVKDIRDRNYLDFKDAKCLVKKLNIKHGYELCEYIRNNPNIRIPVSYQSFYKKDWNGVKNFLES